MGFGWFFGSFSERRFAAMSHIAELGRTEGGGIIKRGGKGEKRGKRGKGKKKEKGGKEKKRTKKREMGKEREKKEKERKGGEEKKRGRKGNYLKGEKCLEQQMRWKIGKEKLCRFGE